MNLLLYAYDAGAPQHARAKAWLEKLFNSAEIIGLPWVTIWAFLRISTNPRASLNAKSTAIAFQASQSWLAHPAVRIIEPGPRHLQILERFVAEYSVTGPLVSDAVLAAIAFEHGAVLASADRDFSRFADLRWINPLA